MKNIVIIDEKDKYLKGNLHIHTTISDGCYTVEEVCCKYKELGYDFLAITNHDIVYGGPEEVEGLVIIPGVEVACTYVGDIDARKGSYTHFNLFGKQVKKYDVIRSGKYENIQEIENKIQKFRDEGILVQYNHPNFSRFSDQEYLDLNCFDMIEIYNHKDFIMETCVYSADAIIRNYLMYAKKFMISCGDDYHGSLDKAKDSYHRKSFVMVNARRDSEDIVENLRNGNFYVSNGPIVKDLRIVDDIIMLKTSLVKRVIFYNFNRRSKNLYSENGFNECIYEIKGNERYIFIKIEDMKGNTAWIQPIYVN